MPGQVREIGLFDLDYDPSDLVRLNEIFDQLPDRTVLDVAQRLKSLAAEKTAGFCRVFGGTWHFPCGAESCSKAWWEGLTVVAHAGREGVSVNTARTHMRRLLEKTGSAGQLDLIRKAHGKS